MFYNQIYSSKVNLGTKRGQLAREVTGVYCQKNGSQKIFPLATQKDNESKEQRGKKKKKMHPLRQMATILIPKTM